MTTRDRLIESAQELLWERGYTAMSPKAVQERSGAGQGSMYHHFAGKADLAAIAIESSARSFREGAAIWLDKPGTPLERLRGYLLRSRKALKGCPMGRLTQDAEIAENEALRRPLATTFSWLHRRLKGLIEEAQAQGEIAAAWDADAIAMTLVTVIQGGYVVAGAARSAKPFHQAIRGMLQMLSMPEAE